MSARKQFKLSFEGGLLDQFPDFKAIAADIDYSPSLLSRMLVDNPDDPRNFPVDRLPDLIEATGDRRPVLWLVEKFLEDAESQRRHAMEQLASVMPQLMKALEYMEREK